MATPLPPERRRTHRPSKGPGHGGPARGYSWEPFTKGNEAATKHGAWSARRVDPIAAELVAWALDLDEPDWLKDPSYRAALHRWATREARSRLVYDFWSAHVDDTGCPGCKSCRRWAEQWLEFDKAAARASADLGLTPTSRARLLADLQRSGTLDEMRAERHRGMVSGLAAMLQQAADEFDAAQRGDAAPADVEVDEAEVVEAEVVGDDAEPMPAPRRPAVEPSQPSLFPTDLGGEA